MPSIQRTFTLTCKQAHGITASLSLWQRRFWDHIIRDEDDLKLHFDYTHYNPVKHGLVACPERSRRARPEDYPYSS